MIIIAMIGSQKPKRRIMIIIVIIGSQKPKRRIMIIIAMFRSQRELNTMETTSTHILSLKPHTTNIKKLNDARI